MAMQTGVSSSKALLLVGAGLTGTVVLRNGQLSDVLLNLHELVKRIGETDISSTRIDPVLLTAQIRQLAHEIRELSLSNSITVLNGNSSFSGGLGSYLVPAAAVGAMGYCYMWWKGLSFSDVMFVTKQNMATAVDSVSKQLESLSEALATTKKHLAKRMENLDWKMEELKETSDEIFDNVSVVKSKISQIGFDLESFRELIDGLEEKIDLIESKQDMANSGIWYLCQAAERMKEGPTAKLFQEVTSKLDPPKITSENFPLKGLQFLTDSTMSVSNVVEKPITRPKIGGLESIPAVKSVSYANTRLHRSFPTGLSLATDLFQ